MLRNLSTGQAKAAAAVALVAANVVSVVVVVVVVARLLSAAETFLCTRVEQAALTCWTRPKKCLRIIAL